MTGVFPPSEPLARAGPPRSLLDHDRLLRVLVVALGEDEVAESHINMLRSIRCLHHYSAS